MEQWILCFRLINSDFYIGGSSLAGNLAVEEDSEIERRWNMHNPKATANALAVVGGVLYIICAAWTLISKESFMGLMGSWAHSIDVNALPQKTSDFGALTIGFVTFTIVAWVTGFCFAHCYNYFAKKK